MLRQTSRRGPRACHSATAAPQPLSSLTRDLSYWRSQWEVAAAALEHADAAREEADETAEELERARADAEAAREAARAKAEQLQVRRCTSMCWTPCGIAAFGRVLHPVAAADGM